jgi:hypothetical protein
MRSFDPKLEVQVLDDEIVVTLPGIVLFGDVLQAQKRFPPTCKEHRG